jgi:hypothetical protein
MALANVDLERLKAKVLAAYEADDPTTQKFREYARHLKEGVKPLRPWSVNAVSIVSADGGDNRLSFNPATVELIRVVDSRGNECALDAVASTANVGELNKRIGNGANVVAPLKRLCDDLGKEVGELSYLFGGLGEPGKSTGALRCYRDIVEWAVLYDLATNPNLQWGGDTILIRDGLLRTKSFKRKIFPEIDRRLREATQAHAQRRISLSIVGVAKTSAVLSRLAIALELEKTLAKDYPCYVKVDDFIEADCYNFDRTWLDTYESSSEGEDGQRLYQSMGQLYLVKFGDRSMDPVWPVDVAVWQLDRVEKVLGELVQDAQRGFPIPDYPMAIQRAHDYAKIGGLEMDILQGLLLEGMCQSLDEEKRERLLRFVHLNQTLAAARYKEA